MSSTNPTPAIVAPEKRKIDVNHEAALGTPWATEHMKKINRMAIAIIGTSMVIASAALVLSLSSSPIIPIALLMISLVMVGVMMYKLDFQYINIIDQQAAAPQPDPIPVQPATSTMIPQSPSQTSSRSNVFPERPDRPQICPTLHRHNIDFANPAEND